LRTSSFSIEGCSGLYGSPVAGRIGNELIPGTGVRPLIKYNPLHKITKEIQFKKSLQQ